MASKTTREGVCRSTFKTEGAGAKTGTADRSGGGWNATGSSDGWNATGVGEGETCVGEKMGKATGWTLGCGEAGAEREEGAGP